MQDFAQCIKFNDALVSIWKEQAKVDWQKMSQGQEQSV
jgi:hypothetical protein